MCLDAGVWPGLWGPLLALRDGRAPTWRGPHGDEPAERAFEGPGLRSPEEAAGCAADAPRGCSEASVVTLRTFNIAAVRALRPAPAAAARLLNLVVRVVSLQSGGEVNDCAAVEDPTGAMAAVLTRAAVEALGAALAPGAVLMLIRVSVVVLGACQALVVRPDNVMRVWPAETADPRHSAHAAPEPPPPAQRQQQAQKQSQQQRRPRSGGGAGAGAGAGVGAGSGGGPAGSRERPSASL